MARAADILVTGLEAHGVDRLWCVPGESYLALLDALTGSTIETIACRHEGGAGFAAVADAKMTGRPGVVAVSRGPGATNVSIAIHLAREDAVPLVVLIGQVARDERGRGAFQEVDYGQMFGEQAKGVWEVHDPARLPETLARAFHAAQTGTPGAALVVLPEDMLAEEMPGGETAAPVVAPLPLPVTAPGTHDIDRVMALLADARRPVLIAGGGVADAAGRAALMRAAAAHHLPVVLTFKHQEIFDNASPLYGGYLGFKVPPALVQNLDDSDLVIAVGTRLGDIPTQGYTFPRAPVPKQPLVHVWPDAAMVGRTFAATVGLAADPAAFLDALADRNTPVPEGRRGWAESLHQRAAAMSTYEVRTMDDGLDFGAVVAPLAAQAPRDAIVVMDSGNFSSWIHRIWPWDGTHLSIGAVGGAMGLGVPGAVAACLRHPGRTVLCFAGDGGIMMTGNELATGIAHGAKPKIFVSDNGSYGTIRLHQERDYPRRMVATALTNPDFAAWAESFGAKGMTITTAQEAEGIVAAALAHDGPVLVCVRTSVEAISAYTSITALRRGR